MSLSGYNLNIRDVNEEDAGEYICEIETYGSPLDQMHTLEVLGGFKFVHISTKAGHLGIAVLWCTLKSYFQVNLMIKRSFFLNQAD